MSKDEIIAIKRLPENYVLDGTVIVTVYNRPSNYPVVVAMNSNLPPIFYRERAEAWEELKIDLTLRPNI